MSSPVGPSTQTAQSPRTANRRVIDLVVQTSTVELFADYSVAVAPVHSSAVPHPGCPPDGTVSVIGFEARGFSGRLCLYVAEAILERTCKGEPEGHSARDWCRELANQLLGRIKNRLVRYQVTLRIGLPSTAAPDAIDRYRTPGTRSLEYVFHAVRGDVVVLLVGTFDESALVFNSVDPKVSEGDVLLF